MVPEAKDANALYLTDPENFTGSMEALIEGATELPDAELEQAEQRAAAAKSAWPRCRELAEQPDILEEFAKSAERGGVAGEVRALKLLYLIMTSRVLDHPVSAVLKGPSSAGKSFLVTRASRYFPESAYLAVTSTSSKALAYTNETLSHRVLIIYEAAGISGDFQSYLLRTLMSEGDIRYITVDSTEAGLAARSLHVEGPTSLILTTTLGNLHPENETRMLSIPVDDSRADQSHTDRYRAK